MVPNVSFLSEDIEESATESENLFLSVRNSTVAIIDSTELNQTITDDINFDIDNEASKNEIAESMAKDTKSNKTTDTIPFISMSSHKDVSINSSNISESNFENELLLQPSKQKPRICLRSSDCQLDLNERCVPNGSHRICSCAQPFRKNSETNVCEIISGVKIVARFGSTAYKADLNRVNSPTFIKMKNWAENALWSLIRQSSILSEGISEIKVIGFSKGSLLVHALILIHSSLIRNRKRIKKLDLVLATEFSLVIDNFSKQLDNFGTQVNASDITIIDINTDVNPCELNELNYCSKNAICVQSNEHSLNLGFQCKCKKGYADSSPHPSYLGESCSVECPQSYCSNDGHCHVDDENGLYCTCQDWNIGPRCQYSGVIVLSALAVIVALLMLIVGCSVYAFCGWRSRNNTSQNAQLMVDPQYEEAVRNMRVTIDNHYEPEENHLREKRRVCEEIEVTEADNRQIPSIHNSSQSLLNVPSPVTATTSTMTATNVNSLMATPGQYSVLSKSSGYQTPRVLHIPPKTKNSQTQVTWF
ncbi:serine-rich adhesin for platelets-like protein [Dinothrombium tinctorium]|uniref:Serine-rich adhesin for platelets-like protein n=1 Tax=Dinothrombium tinctorium TaxID=1965070 RepID=A0A443REI3_9ACAR|nr:serine-rich adhesin for platelets-like protein [Dinothrombium tinctorium]